MNAFNAAQSDLEKSNRSIVVIGSTGRTGRFVLNEGLRRGHSMTAFTRRPEGLVGVRGLKAIVQGDGRNLDDIRRAVAGQDAVISIVGTEGRGPTTVMSAVTTAELEAMREAGVRRLVTVSVSAIEGRHPWIVINLVRWILRKPYADFAAAVSLERTQDGPGSNPNREEGSPEWPVPHLPGRPRGDARRSCGRLGARRRSALGERAAEIGLGQMGRQPKL